MSARFATSRPLKWTPEVRLAVGLLTAITLFHFWYCTHLDIIADEAYYFLWLKHLAASYYSKGPAIAWTIAFGTALFGDNAFGIRWISVLLAAGTGWQLFLLARRLYDEKTALASLIVAGVTPLFTAGAILMTIDPLSVFFWVWGANLFLDAIGKDRWFDWVLAGFAVGCGFLAKFVNALELVAFLGFLAWAPDQRRHLKNPKALLLLAVFVFCTIPIFYWNSQHGWITATHLKARGAIDHGFRIAPYEFWSFFREQALVISPLLFAGVLIAAASLLLRPKKSDAEKFLLLLFGSVFVFYAALALNRAGEANWTATSYVGAIILTAAVWRRLWQEKRGWMCVIVPTLAAALIQSVALHETGPLHLPAGMDPLDRARGWKSFGEHVETAREKYRPDYIIGNKYQTASLASYYLPGHPQTYIINSDEVENQFSFWPKYRVTPESKALFITEKFDEIPENLRNDFKRIERVDNFFTMSDGRVLEHFYIYLCQSLPVDLPKH